MTYLYSEPSKKFTDACRRNDFMHVDMLMAQYPYLIREHSNTILTYARSEKMSGLLIKRGANVHAVDRIGATLFRWMCLCGTEACAMTKVLLAHDCKPDFYSIRTTMLHCRFDVARILFDHGATVSPRDLELIVPYISETDRKELVVFLKTWRPWKVLHHVLTRRKMALVTRFLERLARLPLQLLLELLLTTPGVHHSVILCTAGVHV